MIDYRFRLTPEPEKADSNVVIIAIDDRSLEFFKQNGITYPWPRSYYAYLVNYFTVCQSKAVIFDMQFYEPDIDREETDSAETDGAFAEAMKDNGGVILGIQLSEDSLAQDKDLSRFDLQVDYSKMERSGKYIGLIAPIDIFLESATGLGVINVEPDRDGVIRRIPIIHTLNDYDIPQMAFSAWYNSRSNKDIIKHYPRNIEVGKTKIPLDREGNYFLNWYGSVEAKKAFRYYPFQAVISSASSYFYGGEPVIPLKAFKDKYIIIGATAAGLLDLKTNPFTKILPGMEIWATALSNLLQTDFVRFVPIWINFLFVFLIIYLVLYSVSHFSARYSNPFLLLLLIAIIVVIYLSWDLKKLIFDATFTVLGFVLSYLLIVTVSYLLEGKSKREIRKIFTRYLHPDVIRKLEDDPDRVQLGGEEINATVLYTDIYNFTSISETKTPNELVEDLNTYFQKLTGLVLEHGGLLDKYTGDGIMAIFGAPISRKDHAMIACQAAISHKKLRSQLTQKEKLSAPEQFHVKTRTGINSGPLVAGNIGSDKRMDYTAIGDTVNLASRLEGVNKIFRTNIIISESTHELVKQHFICRELDYLRVKGKKEPTRIYELIDDADAEVDTNWIDNYKKGLTLYREGKFKEAMEVFSQLKDNASQVILDRCKYLIKNPPEEWDGILTLEVK